MRFCGRCSIRARYSTVRGAVYIRRDTYLYVSVIIGTWLWALSVELECSAGVRELTSSIFYARCLLLGYVCSALCR